MLIFDVPTQYFFQQTVNSETYDRNVAVTFHDRNNVNTAADDSCFSNKAGLDYCPTSHTSWANVDDSDDGCYQNLMGVLDFDNLMRDHGADNDTILIQTTQRTINEISTATWELYLTAFIETWGTTSVVSALAGEGDLDTAWTGSFDADHLTITEERYSSYNIPFRISFPQKITVDEFTLQTTAQLISLYAILKQEIVDIQFNPSDNVFGQMLLTVQTQVQDPYRLRSISATAEPILLSTGSFTAALTSDEYAQGCDSVSANTADSNHDGYCYQNWYIQVDPTQCDVSGTFSLQFWGDCIDGTTQCALDINAGTTSSNSYTGVLDFEVVAQSFCPTVLDTIETSGEILKWVDSDLMEAAIPGSNLFVNDFVYVETILYTKSEKSGLTYADGDDSLIEFVRVYNIDLVVSLTDDPLQTSVNADNGDITVQTSPTHYTINLCNTLAFEVLTFPYSTPSSCYDSKGWNAHNYMDFGELTETSSSSTNDIDPNEIAWKVRLDERAIPVDLPNSNSQITIQEDIEIYYYGNENPVRRRLSESKQLSSQGLRQQKQTLTDTFSISKSKLEYCDMNPASAYAGFKLDMTLDRLDIPVATNLNEHIQTFKYQLGQYLQTQLQRIEIYQVNSCVGGICLALNQRRNLNQVETVQYYIDVQDPVAARKLHDDLFNRNSEVMNSDWLKNKAVNTMEVDHCSDELLSIFNRYRSSAEIYKPDVVVVEDDSVSGLFVGLTLLLLGLYF